MSATPEREGAYFHLRTVIVAASLLCTTLLSCHGTEGPAPGSGGTPRRPETPALRRVAAKVTYAKPYRFTQDWFSPLAPSWSTVLDPLRGKPGLRYLEVGVYEGRSFLWVLENVLTHPSSQLTGIDIELTDNLKSNIEMSGQARRMAIIIGASQTELKKLKPQSFDIIYVDGSHTADNVLTDAVLSWQLLRKGGVIIFDDYRWDGRHFTNRDPAAPQLTPALGIDGFVAAFRYEIEILRKGYQIFLRKTTNPCATAGMKSSCSPFGRYVYDWREGRLLPLADLTKTVGLSPSERVIVESILRAGGVNEKTRALEGFDALRERLRLEL